LPAHEGLRALWPPASKAGPSRARPHDSFAVGD
jgi:hypothetical protein